MDQLALLGGPRSIPRKFRKYNSIGREEEEAAISVIRSGVLSRYIGAWDKDFIGGPKVVEFENLAANYFGVRHAITVNSWTSGLVAAVGAIGIEPGDEVIVTPWTMTATASAILHWSGLPIFADIDPDTFNLCPRSIEKNISPYTRAIIVADIFGQSADIDEIMDIAEKNNLKVISDTAQAPGALYKGRFAGTCAHVGGYSLNYHKHIHTGEGGILVTNDDRIANRLRLIRNHAEAVVEGMGIDDISNMVGHNFRLGEIECAIGIEQLKKLEKIVKTRQMLANRLSRGICNLPGLRVPVVKQDRSHVYYVYPMQIDTNYLKISRDRICDALVAEGVDVSRRYQNIHLLPLYQKKIAFGNKGFPWFSGIAHRDISYKKGICPIAENLNDSIYMGIGMCVYDFNLEDIDMIVFAFHKVWGQLDSLR